MNTLNQNELKQMKGGFSVALGIVSAASFIIFLSGIIDGIVHPKECTEEQMKTLSNNELKKVKGGFNLTGPIATAFVTFTKFLYEMGQALGSSLRRIREDALCPLE